MPRVNNPDPKGYMMAAAEQRALKEAEGDKSVAQLISTKSEDKTEVFKRNNEEPTKNKEEIKRLKSGHL